jgi:DNA-3-methyladenine glycosylase II
VYARARRHLSRKDAVLRPLIARVGPCTLQPDGDGFGSLVRAVVSQLISTQAARSILARLEAAVGELTPAAVLAAGEERLRGAGLSGAKARALADLAGRVREGLLPLDELDVLPVGDFGLRAGVRDVYKLANLPGPAALREVAEPWRPYRSIATWYLWRSRGFVPQSG